MCPALLKGSKKIGTKSSGNVATLKSKDKSTVAAGKSKPKCSLSLVAAKPYPYENRDFGSYTCQDIQKNHGTKLTSYEKKEIKNYNPVYYWGAKVISEKKQIHRRRQNAALFCDANGEYVVIAGDQIEFRYEILSLISKGSYGQVVSVYDHGSKKFLAIKMIKQESDEHNKCSIFEFQLVKLLNCMEKNEKKKTVVGVHRAFLFRGFFCIVFDLMTCDLATYRADLLPDQASVEFLHCVATQTLESLATLEDASVVHGDLKLENILLHQTSGRPYPVVVLGDFGLASFTFERRYQLIQTRWYRAPEVLLGMEYDTSADMWSFGCVLAELWNDETLFPGSCSEDQLFCIMELLGPYPLEMLRTNKRVSERGARLAGFLQHASAHKNTTWAAARSREVTIGSRPWKSVLKGAYPAELLELIQACLTYRPDRRIKPREALASKFITAHRRKLARKLDAVAVLDEIGPDCQLVSGIRHRYRRKGALQTQMDRPNAGARRICSVFAEDYSNFIRNAIREKEQVCGGGGGGGDSTESLRALCELVDEMILSRAKGESGVGSGSDVENEKDNVSCKQ